MFYSESLPKSPTSAVAARALVDRLGEDLSAATLDDVRLLLSELFANAVEHVREEGDIEVRIALDDGVLRVEVHDPGPGFAYTPRVQGARDSDRGWGLVFTERVASRWGNARGLVWFELDRS